jgi:hypothetical protein
MPKVSRPGEHDPELTERRGMSTEGKEVDEAETMASTGVGWETGPDLDEGDLSFFEEDQPEDED